MSIILFYTRDESDECLCMIPKKAEFSDINKKNNRLNLKDSTYRNASFKFLK